MFAVLISVLCLGLFLFMLIPVSLKITMMTLDPYSSGSLRTKKRLSEAVIMGIVAWVIVAVWRLL
jgi:hypothetical protein